MTTIRRVPWLAAALLLGCQGPRPAPSAPTEPPAAPTPAPAMPPPAAAAAGAAPAPAMQRLGNGLTAAVEAAPGATADIQLALLAGADFLLPGLAELAAATLLEQADASRGWPGLREAIARLGGTIAVEIGPTTTWLSVRITASAWPQAVAALAQALAMPTASRAQVDRSRERWIQSASQAVLAGAPAALLRPFLLGDAGPGPQLAALLDRDASEVALFTSRLYRPELALLALRVPGDPAAAMAALAEGPAAAIGRWQPAPGGTGALAQTPRRLATGLYWAAGPAPVRAVLALPLPEPSRDGAADLLLMHACLTLDGLGGRLEAVLQQRGLGGLRWRSEVVRCGELAVLALQTTLEPAQVEPLWQAIDAARQSLLALPPTASELQLARRRARLTATLGNGDPAVRQRLRTTGLLLGRDHQALLRRLDQLDAGAAMDSKTIASAYLAQPYALVVVGGERPAALAAAQPFDLLPPGSQARLASADPQQQSAGADPWLLRAEAALGGTDLLKRLRGYRAESLRQATEAPEARDVVVWGVDGALERTRTVLGGRIVTRLAGDKATEEFGTEQVALGARDVAVLRREFDRHPLALLAAHARGELRFRPVARRSLGDRELMVLEATGERFARLRLHLDTTSHLVRLVESWETLADGTSVHLRESWSDYRPAGPLRAPYRLQVEQDDGQHRIETVWSTIAPVLAPF